MPIPTQPVLLQYQCYVMEHVSREDIGAEVAENHMSGIDRESGCYEFSFISLIYLFVSDN